MAEEWDVIDEVDNAHVSAVVSARPDVISPARVGIRHVAKVSTAVTGGSWVDGVRQRVERPESQVMANLRVKVYLQAIVVSIGFVVGEVNGVESGEWNAGRSGVVGTTDEIRQVALIRQVDLAVIVLMAALISNVTHR